MFFYWLQTITAFGANLRILDLFMAAYDEKTTSTLERSDRAVLYLAHRTAVNLTRVRKINRVLLSN